MGGGAPVSAVERLETLALSDVLIRRATYGRQLDVRAARTAGASWTRIGAACGVSEQWAREAHDRWLSGQAELHRDSGHEGLDPAQVGRARAVAGQPDD